MIACSQTSLHYPIIAILSPSIIVTTAVTQAKSIESTTQSIKCGCSIIIWHKNYTYIKHNNYNVTAYMHACCK